jgi:hypothetical protein
LGCQGFLNDITRNLIELTYLFAILAAPKAQRNHARQ